MSYTNGLDDPTQFFNTKLYTGNGSTQTLTGIGFNADLIWLKNRTDSSTSHVLTDSVRTHAKYLKSNAIDSEGTYPFVTNRGSDGYDVASHSWSGASGKNYVAWNWLAGGSASSNSDGSITSSVSASTDAGFSIVSYTGTGSSATVGHGLGAVPSVMIFKNRIDTTNWVVYHHKNTSAPETDYLYLNRTNATSDYQHHFNDTAPTSSVFTLGYDNGVNDSSDAMIAYCFAEKKGYSKFGSYTGNGNADGTFIFTGFKPAMVIIKRTDSAGYEWRIVDNKRLGYNGASYSLNPNDSSAEGTSDRLSFLSNGIKLTTSATSFNASGGTYIYLAFASASFVSSGNVPCTGF